MGSGHYAGVKVDMDTAKLHFESLFALHYKYRISALLVDDLKFDDAPAGKPSVHGHSLF